MSEPQLPTSTQRVWEFLSSWSKLRVKSVKAELVEAQEAVLLAVLPYAFPTLDGAEMADDVWQTAMSWFSNGDVVTDSTLKRFESNLVQEIDHAAKSWVNYHASRLQQALAALQSLSGWMGDTVDEAKLNAWMTDGSGFDWWVTSSVLMPSHKKVCLTLLSSGVLDQANVQASWERLHHPLASRQHHRALKKGSPSNWRAAPWPGEWIAAWERGRLLKRTELQLAQEVGNGPEWDSTAL
jgi:hypothetical protein